MHGLHPSDRDGVALLDKVQRHLPWIDHLRGPRVVSHGAICFFVQDQRPVCYFHDNHRGDGRISLWCPAPPGVQEELVAGEPERFFKPPTSARGTFSDWLAVYLDTSGANRVDWHEIAAIIEDAYRMVAPKQLIAELDRRT